MQKPTLMTWKFYVFLSLSRIKININICLPTAIWTSFSLHPYKIKSFIFLLPYQYFLILNSMFVAVQNGWSGRLIGKFDFFQYYVAFLLAKTLILNHKNYLKFRLQKKTKFDRNIKMKRSKHEIFFIIFIKISHLKISKILYIIIK